MTSADFIEKVIQTESDADFLSHVLGVKIEANPQGSSLNDPSAEGKIQSIIKHLEDYAKLGLEK